MSLTAQKEGFVTVSQQGLPRYSFTVREAQQVTGLGRDTLLNAIKRNELDAVQRGPQGLGAKYFINAESLKRFVSLQPEATQANK